MTSPLTAYLVTAMNAWVPMSEHAYLEPLAVTEARYLDIANDVASVTSEEDPLFAGEDGQEKTALLLLSIASYESHFAARIDDCSVTGDHGKALGLWQTHAPRDSVCNGRLDAIRVAIRMVRQSFTQCQNFPVLDRLGFYTDGVCKLNWDRSQWRVGRAVRYLKAHPFDVAPS